MYKTLTDTNQVLGYVDKPNYIKLAENGDILPAVPVEAVGLNFKGTLYNLLGHHDIEGAATAYASMVTDGELNAMKENAEQQTTALQLGLVEAYEQSLQAQASAEKQVTDLQLALVELYESTLPPEESARNTEPTG